MAGRHRDATRGDHAGRRTRESRPHRHRPRAFDGHHSAIRLNDEETSGEPGFGQTLLELLEVVADDGLQIRVERGGGRALELANLRKNLAAHRHVRVRPHLAHDASRGLFVGRIGVRVKEADRDRPRATVEELARDSPHLGRVDCFDHGSISECPLGDFGTHVAFDDGAEVPPQTPRARPIAATHLQNVGESSGCDDSGTRSFSFEKGVGADRRAVNDRLHVTERHRAGDAPNPVEKALRLVRSRGGDFSDRDVATRLVESEHVGEGSTDVDPDDHEPLPVT